MPIPITLKRGTAANLTSSGLVPLEGEPVFDMTNNVLKVGDGESTFDELDPIGASSDASGFQTFTPTLSFAGGSTGITYTRQKGIYRNNGNAIEFVIDLKLSSKGSSTGELRVGGLPVVCDNSWGKVPVTAMVENFAFQPSAMLAFIAGNTSYIAMRYIEWEALTAWSDTQVTNTSGIFLSGTYPIAA